MELHSVIQSMLWVVVDGLGALWVLHTVVRIAADGGLLNALLLLAGSICG